MCVRVNIILYVCCLMCVCALVLIYVTDNVYTTLKIYACVERPISLFLPIIFTHIPELGDIFIKKEILIIPIRSIDFSN